MWSSRKVRTKQHYSQSSLLLLPPAFLCQARPFPSNGQISSSHPQAPLRTLTSMMKLPTMAVKSLKLANAMSFNVPSPCLKVFQFSGKIPLVLPPRWTGLPTHNIKVSSRAAENCTPFCADDQAVNSRRFDVAKWCRSQDSQEAQEGSSRSQCW